MLNTLFKNKNPIKKIKNYWISSSEVSITINTSSPSLDSALPQLNHI